MHDACKIQGVGWVHAAYYLSLSARSRTLFCPRPAAPTQAGRRPLLSASPYRPAARPGREDHARGAAAARHEPHGQARPMGEGRQCDARGPMALGAHEYTYM